ncbi:hypothetical protein HJG60_012251 [Phyllostomus discolor]|uniref:Uncharacterized protein n=1 Tax=Phyllostomus discolor TaxID=89673 RepID=A0A834DST5_9CHIR|nr:hypothetical protein HJG60_012251 [Phyllostomus discolor]
MTSRPMKGSQLRPQTEDIGEQTQAIPTLPCLNSSSTECLSMIKWSLFRDAMLPSGRWLEHILSRLHPFFIRVHLVRHQDFVFRVPFHFAFIHCLLHPPSLVFYTSFHSFLLHCSTFICSADFTVL